MTGISVIDNFNDKMKLFRGHCKRYGYKIKIDEVTYMKRNGNIISLDDIPNELKIKGYVLKFKKPETCKDFVKLTRPELYKDGELIAKNITAIENLIGKFSEIL